MIHSNESSLHTLVLIIPQQPAVSVPDCLSDYMAAWEGRGLPNLHMSGCSQSLQEVIDRTAMTSNFLASSLSSDAAALS
jgi:hypothetical protein